MTGIEHNTAGVKIREQFSFTNAQAQRAMEYIKSLPGIRGCVLLSTCNRMELWVSCAAEADDMNIDKNINKNINIDLPGIIGQVKQIDVDAKGYRKYFVSRSSERAAEHLFYLTAGLKSRILCEDQILAQVKDALKKAREVYCTDTLLEVLFRYAITAGKEVRTKVPAVHADLTAAHHAIAGLKQQGYGFAGKKCLVIGNGQMGKIAAQALKEEGAAVTVTVRQYHSGMVEIPAGCDRIQYGERYAVMPECDLVVSATASPNLTIRKEELAQAAENGRRQQIYIDLAVPRDIEEEIAQLDGITLYDIDSFQSDGESDAFIRQQQAAAQILSAKLAELKDWYECREIIPRIQQISRAAAADICWRMGRAFSGAAQDDREQFRRLLEESSAKAVDKLLFALRDGLPREELYHCVEILEKIHYK